jgi:hypothetical protein
MSGTYKDLEVWQCAMALVLEVYRSTAKFPREEMFGLPARSGGPPYPWPATSLKA